MKIYSSTQYIKEPKVGDFKLKVNSMWDFRSRDVCFNSVASICGGSTVIGYDLEECIEVTDGIIIGGTEKVKNTKWKQAEITKDIIGELKNSGYTIAKALLQD